MAYESLTDLIEPYVGGVLGAMPADLQQRVCEVFIVSWDDMTPNQRRLFAQQHDVQHDPAMEPENKYWRDLGSEIWETEAAITKWKTTNGGDKPSEALIRENKLNALGDRLSNLKKMYKLPPFLVEEPKALTNDALAKLASETSMPVPAVVGVSKDAKNAPHSLSTGEVAHCFAGLRWTEQQWKKPLGDKPKWLHACVVTCGVRGVIETQWDPVCIGAALVRAGHARVNNIRAKFQTVHLLKPWLEAWKTYEADNFDTK